MRCNEADNNNKSTVIYYVLLAFFNEPNAQMDKIPVQT